MPNPNEINEVKTQSTDTQVKKVGEGDKYTFVVSTESIDRDGDIIRVNGWDLKNYKSNPVVLYGHGHSSDNGLPIGRATKLWKDTSALPKKLMMEMEFIPKEIYPFAGLVRELVDKGFIKTGSVRFLPKEFKEIDVSDIPENYTGLKGREYTKQEMVEYSVVPLPANPDCVKLEMKSKELAQSKDVLEWLSREINEDIEKEEKQGRILSKKNEELIRTAVNVLTELLNSVSSDDEENELQFESETDLSELFDKCEKEIDSIEKLLEEDKENG